MESHGADIYSAARKLGTDTDNIIDFSSNINPLGIPALVKAAAINSIADLNKYPDINCRELTKSISKAEGVPESWIFSSNGAAEAIFRIAFYLKPKKGLVTAPAFSEYENSLKAINCHVEYYNLYEEYDFKIQDNIQDCINTETNIVFLCNPNNPTGQITNRHTMERIIQRCKETGTFVVVDECFLDFVENKDEYSTVKLLDKYDNLIVLKAFTKIYAVPGVRLGYCISSNIALIEGLQISGPPWNVSTMAQAVGVAALEEKDYVIKTVEYIKEQRKYLAEELNKLNIINYDAYANYIFFKNNEAMDLKDELLKLGILIRSCSNYKNLSNNYYRIAVKSSEENQLFIKALKEIKGRQ